MLSHSCSCVTCCAVTKIAPPCSCVRVASKCSCRENESLRNVWRVVSRASNSTFLLPFRICHVSYASSGTCARIDSLRNVWRASCRLGGGVLSSPILAVSQPSTAETDFGANVIINSLAFFGCGARVPRAQPPEQMSDDALL